MLWLSRSRPTKPQVANMRKYPFLMAGAMIGALFSFAGANAQAGGPLTNETWLCTDKTASDQDRPPHEYLLQNGYLTAQPLGAPRYRVLDSTPYLQVPPLRSIATSSPSRSRAGSPRCRSSPSRAAR